MRTSTKYAILLATLVLGVALALPFRKSGPTGPGLSAEPLDRRQASFPLQEPVPLQVEPGVKAPSSVPAGPAEPTRPGPESVVHPRPLQDAAVPELPADYRSPSFRRPDRSGGNAIPDEEPASRPPRASILGISPEP